MGITCVSLRNREDTAKHLHRQSDHNCHCSWHTPQLVHVNINKINQSTTHRVKLVFFGNLYSVIMSCYSILKLNTTTQFNIYHSMFYQWFSFYLTFIYCLSVAWSFIAINNLASHCAVQYNISRHLVNLINNYDSVFGDRL